jgi:hypothetical protein
MASKPRWGIPLIAAVASVVFLIIIAGSASAATIHGTVKDMNGVKVVGATVRLYQNGQDYVHQNNPTRTDASGYYQFSGLPAGDYSVQADKDGFISISESASTINGDVTKDLGIPGYDSRAAMPTVQVYVTITPTPAPPTPTPTPKPCPTLVPLPTPTPTPGFGLLLAFLSLSLIAAVKRSRR